MRWTKAGVVGVGLVVSLGCSGLQTAAQQLTGATLEVKEGADAVLPAGFPLALPAGGQLTSVVVAGLGPTMTTTAVVEVPSASDLPALIAPYEPTMTAAGMTVERETRDGTEILTGTKGSTAWTVTASVQNGATMVTMTVVETGT